MDDRNGAFGGMRIALGETKYSEKACPYVINIF
jgi:hypothetical protein